MEYILGKLIKRNYPKLTKSEKKVAEYIMQNPEEVAFLTSKDLGRKVKVSDATVIRLANALGVSGFSDLQKISKSWLKKKLAPSEKLRSTKIDRRTNIFELVFEISMKNILKAREEISITKLQNVVKRLDDAKRIFVIGLRRSHSFAFYLYYNLSRILDNISLVDMPFGLVYDEIKDIGSKDVLVSISFSRYTKETFEVTRYARRKKAFVIAITDNPLSPIGQLANVALCVDYGSPLFLDHMQAPL